jgi:uncharacterized phage-like protein YoqJ
MSITVAFTGHRPKDLFGYRDDAAWQRLRERIAQYLTVLARLNEHVTVITGGAQGVDQTAFWASTDVRDAMGNLDTQVYVPFAGQESRWLQTGTFSQDEYHRMLSTADNVNVLHPALDDGDNRQAVQLLMARNRAMVDAADILIAVTDMDVSKPASKGGTAATIRYAKSQGKRIEQIRPRG